MKIENKSNHKKIQKIDPGEVVNINGILFLVSTNYSIDSWVGCIKMSDGEFTEIKFGTSCLIDDGTYVAITENLA